MATIAQNELNRISEQVSNHLSHSDRAIQSAHDGMAQALIIILSSNDTPAEKSQQLLRLIGLSVVAGDKMSLNETLKAIHAEFSSMPQ